MIQCTLQKQDTTMVAWIPSKFAQSGRHLKIQGVDGWTVVDAFGGTKLDQAYVREHQRISFGSI